MKFTEAGLEFLTERHLATLTTLRPDGMPHVVPVGFTWDDDAGLARVIASSGSRKVRHVDANGVVVLCQVDGRRWLSLQGQAFVRRDPTNVAEGERLYTERYRVPRENPRRVVIEVVVQRVLGSAELHVPD